MSALEAQNRSTILCIGGAVVDRKYRAKAPLIQETSNPVRGHRNFGGVARNVAENLARLGAAVGFVSAIGDDDPGRSLCEHLAAAGCDAAHVATVPGRQTAEYVAVLAPDGELMIGLADMDIFEALDPSMIEGLRPVFRGIGWVFADCNLSAGALAALFAAKTDCGFHLAVDTVSAPKAARLPADLSAIDVLFTNTDEANAILRVDAVAPLDALPAARALQDRGAANVVVTQGARGCIVAMPDRTFEQQPVKARIIDITGAGDALIAGTLFRILQGEALDSAIGTGALLAALTIESEASVRPDLSTKTLASSSDRLTA